MLPLFTYLHAWFVAGAARAGRCRDDAGQTTAEYALVLMGAAAVAVLLIGWATKTDRIGKLFDAVVDSVSGRVK
jgi:Flp pilus assembly pilin Flp